MKFTYPAIIRPAEDGVWRAILPDLACCEAEGDSVEEAVERANEALYDWIYLELTEDEGELPPISDPRDLELQEGDQVRNICVNIRLTDGWDE
ncbi:MAG: type II toxin-antitoxin system HicB family antitoxin [Eubacteriales bacterium]|nr:type II toxin-antitoxin system HicB family antitoxin [Eubacteriales bacterium]